ncbi:hypothetical protein Tco_0217947 [Tanacetum coccineum]
MSADKKEPSKSWGSTNTNNPSTSLNEIAGCPIVLLGYLDSVARALNDQRSLSAHQFSSVNSWVQLNSNRTVAKAKSSKKPHKPKYEDTNRKNSTIAIGSIVGHACLPRVVSGKKYILVLMMDSLDLLGLASLMNISCTLSTAKQWRCEDEISDRGWLLNQSRSGPALHEMTPVSLRFRTLAKPSPSTPLLTPTRSGLGMWLFQTNV